MNILKAWLLLVLLPLAVLAEGAGIDTGQVGLSWVDGATTASSTTVTGDEDKFSTSIRLPGNIFNAISITLALTSAGSPSIVPRLQIQSPADATGSTWTELHSTPVLSIGSGSLTAAGHYVFAVSVPLARAVRIRLDGVTGGAATTVTGVVTFQ